MNLTFVAALAALALLGGDVADAHFTTMGVGGAGGAPAGYQGPGDVIPSGWVAWGGLRAFSAAKAGTEVAKIRCVTAGTTNGISSLANGNFDTATLQSLCPSDTYFITQLDDQTGNANNFTQVTAAQQPQLNLNALNTTLPKAHFTRSSTTFVTTPTIVQAQPFSVITHAQQSGIGGAQAAAAFPNQFKTIFGSSVNLSLQNCGSALNVTVAPTTYYTLGGTCASSASNLFANATTASGAGGAVSVNAGYRLGADDGPNPLDGDATEIGFLNVALSAGQWGSYHTNACTYWATTC